MPMRFALYDPGGVGGKAPCIPPLTLRSHWQRRIELPHLAVVAEAGIDRSWP